MRNPVEELKSSFNSGSLSEDELVECDTIYFSKVDISELEYTDGSLGTLLYDMSILFEITLDEVYSYARDIIIGFNSINSRSYYKLIGNHVIIGSNELDIILSDISNSNNLISSDDIIDNMYKLYEFTYVSSPLCTVRRVNRISVVNMILMFVYIMKCRPNIDIRSFDESTIMYLKKLSLFNAFADIREYLKSID